MVGEDYATLFIISNITLVITVVHLLVNVWYRFQRIKLERKKLEMMEA